MPSSAFVPPTRTETLNSNFFQGFDDQLLTWYLVTFKLLGLLMEKSAIFPRDVQIWMEANSFLP
jgi:hypothetical protein